MSDHIGATGSQEPSWRGAIVLGVVLLVAAGAAAVWQFMALSSATREPSEWVARADQASVARDAAMWFGIVSVVLAGGLATLALSMNRYIERSREVLEQDRQRRLAAEHSLQCAEAERGRLLASERAARTDAARAAQMKDDFVSTLSHELRTPLNAIVGWLGILKYDQSAETVNQALTVIDRSARHQSQLIEDLLDTSRIALGKMHLDVQQVDLPSIIEEAVRAARPAANAKEIELRASLATTATVLGDRGRLRQVVWNLVTNAVKFTPRGGLVTLSLERSDREVTIRVADTGQGIARDILPLVFDQFQQGDASITRKRGGLGLGLTLVKALVELHGGAVDAASDGESQGSTFTVRLPAVPLFDAGERASEQGVPGVSSPSLASRRSSLTVLVVEDDVDCLALLQRFLADAGATVATASSATDAINQLDQGLVPDVIISDIGMPDVDGYTFIRRIRQHEGPVSSVPALALTAFARDTDRERALAAGFQAHLVKPLEPMELLTTLGSLTRHKGLLRS